MEKSNFLEGEYYYAGDGDLYAIIAGSGKPTVVFETACGSLSTEWQGIFQEISKITTSVLYDRAGYAESKRNKKPRTANQISRELATMLDSADVPTPFVLVGHSEGGFYSQFFAKMFPQWVGGLVLVDSITSRYNEFDNLDAPFYQQNLSFKVKKSNLDKYVEMDKEDFQKIIAPTLQKIYADFPEEIKIKMITYQSDQLFFKTIVEEFEALEESFAEFEKLPPLPNIFVKILCRDYKEMIKISKEIGMPEEEAKLVEELWLQQSKDLLSLSRNSVFKIIEGSSHYIHLSCPGAVVSEIADIIKKVQAQL